jgi:hypothetical protein
MKLFGSFDMTGNPLLILGAFMCIVSVQFFSVGLLGEANTRLYYRRGERRPFTIRKVVSRAGRDTLPLRRAG